VLACAESEVRDVRGGVERAEHLARGRGQVEGRSLNGDGDLPHRQAGRVRRVVAQAWPTGQEHRASRARGTARRVRAAAGHGRRAGGGAASARGKIALGPTAGPVPPRVDACVKAAILELIDHAVGHGWSTRAACHAIGLDDLRAARWADRRTQGRLDDAAPGGHPVHGLLDWERQAIVGLHAEWGERDRSHRKLAHRGSYLDRVWVSESTVRKVLGEEGLGLQGNPPRDPIARKPWPDWLEWKPNRVWGYDFTHFTRAKRCAIAILDIVSRKWITTPGLG
jgi:hypothetical protein